MTLELNRRAVQSTKATKATKAATLETARLETIAPMLENAASTLERQTATQTGKFATAICTPVAPIADSRAVIAVAVHLSAYSGVLVPLLDSSGQARMRGKVLETGSDAGAITSLLENFRMDKKLSDSERLAVLRSRSALSSANAKLTDLVRHGRSHGTLLLSLAGRSVLAVKVSASEIQIISSHTIFDGKTVKHASNATARLRDQIDVSAVGRDSVRQSLLTKISSEHMRVCKDDSEVKSKAARVAALEERITALEVVVIPSSFAARARPAKKVSEKKSAIGKMPSPASVSPEAVAARLAKLPQAVKATAAKIKATRQGKAPKTDLAKVAALASGKAALAKVTA